MVRSLPKIAIVILAAGASSRMKSVKQLLPWKNTTLIGNSIEQALASNADAVYVVLGANYQPIFNAIEKKDITIIHHKNWLRGMGSSIACAMAFIKLRSTKYDAVLITLADQPLMDYRYFNILINKSKESSIVASNYKGNAGVPAIFDVLYFDELCKLNNDIGARELLVKYRNDVQLLDTFDLIQDIDVSADYKMLYPKYGK